MSLHIITLRMMYCRVQAIHDADAWSRDDYQKAHGPTPYELIVSKSHDDHKPTRPHVLSTKEFVMAEQELPLPASGDAMPTDLSTFNMADLVKTPHNARLYKEVQKLKQLINELVDYQLAHPKSIKSESRDDLENEKKATQEIEKREKYIRAQLSIIKTLYRQSVLKVREEKAKTSDDRAVNDALILGLHNLKYEEQSLRSEISAAENYEYAPFQHITLHY
jgi:hypothetical protein